VAGSSVLAPTAFFPVLVTEGASDTAALLGLGFVAVGRPSATGGGDFLATLVRGRDVVIFGENDEKSNGQWPGKHGAEKTMIRLEGICPKVRIVFPPAKHKDVRSWIAAGESRESVEEYVNQYAGVISITEDDMVLSDDKIQTIAEAYTKHRLVETDSTLHFCDTQWYNYGEEGWVRNDTPDGTRRDLIRFMAARLAMTVDNRGSGQKLSTKDLNATTSRVNSTLGLVRAQLEIKSAPPTWLDGRETPAANQMLLFKNGRLSVDAYLRGDDALEPNTPALFSTCRLPFDYDVSAGCPRWEQWLQETLGDDPLKIDLLQEWFGYNLIPDTQYEKMLLMHGQGGTGKSTAMGVLSGLLGKNATSSSLPLMGSKFGLAHLVGKNACMLPDAVLPKQGRGAIMQNLLAIVGNDIVPVNQKFNDTLHRQLRTRLTMTTNTLPKLPEESNALQRRILFLRFDVSFTANPDTTLKGTLAGELTGIMQWALVGLARLHNAGKFTVVAAQAEDEANYRNLVHPTAEFSETWLRAKPNGMVAMVAVWEAWKKYCEERGMGIGTQELLYQRLRTNFHNLGRETTMENGHNVKYYTGIDLQSFALNADKHRRIG